MTKKQIESIFNEYVEDCMESCGVSRKEAEILVYQSGMMNEYEDEPINGFTRSVFGPL